MSTENKETLHLNEDLSSREEYRDNLGKQELVTVTGGYRTVAGLLLDALATPSNPIRRSSTPPSPTRARGTAAVPSTLRRTDSAPAVPNVQQHQRNYLSFPNR
jgi:hypothetical protein